MFSVLFENNLAITVLIQILVQILFINCEFLKSLENWVLSQFLFKIGSMQVFKSELCNFKLLELDYDDIKNFEKYVHSSLPIQCDTL